MLFRGLGATNSSIGPLTLDDDTPISICDGATPCGIDPLMTLGEPFAGTANKFFVRDQGTGPLSTFDGLKMRGTWTLTAFDQANIGETSVLNGWGLEIRAAKPVREEKK